MSYIVQDRTTGTNYEIDASDNNFFWQSTLSDASPEPVVRDLVNPNDYWTIFVNNGIIGWEAASEQVNTLVVLVDNSNANVFHLAVSGGMLVLQDLTVAQPSIISNTSGVFTPTIDANSPDVTVEVDIIAGDSGGVFAPEIIAKVVRLITVRSLRIQDHVTIKTKVYGEVIR